MVSPSLPATTPQNKIQNASATRQPVLELGWTIRAHPSAPSGYIARRGAVKSAIAQTIACSNAQEKVAATFFYRSEPSRNDGNRLFTALP
ncbi:hypothetical protein M378DRAFT_874385 [Amanita muscaria Koide BX008]|uniref:Uncharacterized protein n=1 Tax=Amanita muscaria (strain Koide BX008) TaxID=946122 RepID=A0A0C2WXC1_AMAMK|nr:hypothetical protein M378DRAFT_874385 [Amanita muscaria Koide BX008]